MISSAMPIRYSFWSSPYEKLAPQSVDGLALLVHDVVVFEDVLAVAEVLAFNALLRAFDLPGDEARFDGNAFFHAEPLHDSGDAVRRKDAHQVVFERNVEARGARDRPGVRSGREAGCRCAGLRGVPYR